MMSQKKTEHIDFLKIDSEPILTDLDKIIAG